MKFSLVLFFCLSQSYLFSQVNFIQSKVDSIDQYLLESTPKKRTWTALRFSGDIDSTRTTNGPLKISLWGRYRKGELRIIDYYFETRGELGEWHRRYYLQKGKLVFIEEDFFNLIHIGGPNFFEKRYGAKYYFRDGEMIYRKVEGTEEQMKEKGGYDKKIMEDFLLFGRVA